MKINQNGKITKIGDHARQGDTLLRLIDDIPNKTVLKKQKKAILAFGEQSGHSHVFDSGAIAYAKRDEKSELADYIEVKEAIAALTHEEHETIEFPKGVYESLKQVEYSPKEILRVKD